jgi:hypothetical protein
MPPVAEALQRLETELTAALNKKIPTLKLIHGYGSFLARTGPNPTNEYGGWCRKLRS